MAHWSIQRKFRDALIFSFCYAFTFTISPSHAGAIDPIPVFKYIYESLHEESLFSKKNPPFFYPLYKEFYNHDDEVVLQTIILEAVGEGPQGMVAVGEVIRNRAKLFLKDFHTVCLMPKQFSCWNDGDRARQFLEKHRHYYFLALMAWRESEQSGLTGGATDYHTNFIHPYWANAYRIVATIGNHIFYVRK